VVKRIRGGSRSRKLYTDEKREYAQSMKAARREDRIEHVPISNDPFGVNYFDREIRKDCANHVRETVCSRAT
jgi:hypothetical protein